MGVNRVFIALSAAGYFGCQRVSERYGMEGDGDRDVSRRRVLVALAGSTALAGCSALSGGGDDSDADSPTPRPSPTATDTQTATATETPTPTETFAPTVDWLNTDPAVLPVVTATTRKQTVPAELIIEDAADLTRVSVWVDGPYTGGIDDFPTMGDRPTPLETSVSGASDGRWATSFEVPLRYFQPGETLLVVRMHDGTDDPAHRSVSFSTPDVPFLADFNGETERTWDDVPRDLDFMEFYMNDIHYGERAVKGNGRLSSGWDGIEEYIFDHLGEYGDEFHWIQRGVKLVSDALDQKATGLGGSGGFVNAQVPGVKKFMPKITEELDGIEKKTNSLHPGEEGSYEDKFVEWEATSTTEDWITHEQGLLYDWETETLWTHEPQIFHRDTRDMQNIIRPFKESKYARQNDPQHCIGIDYKKLIQQAENGRISRIDAHLNLYGSILNIVDSSMNDRDNIKLPGVGFTESYGEELSDTIHERDGRTMDREEMESLVELSEILHGIGETNTENKDVIIHTEDSIKDFEIYRNVSREQRDQVIAGDYEDLHADVLGYDPENPVV
jgi:hypothetical protein